VDGGSSDASPRIARKLASIVVEGSSSNPARGRNVGIGYAVGDILVFVDADCEISNSWISDAVKILLSDDKIGVVGGAYLPDDSAPGSARDLQFALASPLISLGSIQHRPKKRQSKVSSIPAGVLAVRKKIINEIGAFDPDLTYCEDSELCDRIRGSGYVVLFAPSLLAKHMKTYSLHGLTDLGYRYGRGRALALGKHPRLFTVRNILPVVLLIMGILALSRPIDPTLASNASLTLGVYCLGVIGASVFVSYRQSRLESAVRVVLAHFAVHFSYGLGFVWGIARLARRRILVLFPIIIGILFVAFQQLSALNANGMIIGWDTAHYVYLARYVGDNGILAFLQAQRNSYILYPLLLRSVSIFSGQPPLVVEEYLPLGVTAALFGSMVVYGLRVLRDNLAYAALPLFLVLWVALYRIGADLHSNLLGLSPWSILLRDTNSDSSP
jgi:GT2 family glycosyltransferase